MRTQNPKNPLARTAAAGVLALSAFGLAGCGDTAGNETGASVEEIQENVGDAGAELGAEAEASAQAGADALEEAGADAIGGTGGSGDVLGYEGAYDPGFYNDVMSYADQTVTVSADVDEVVSPRAFVIAGTDDTTVDPLLVVSASEVSGLQQDMTTRVTGTVEQAFDIAAVEQQLGVDWDDAMFEQWAGQPYIMATSVDTSVASGQ